MLEHESLTQHCIRIWNPVSGVRTEGLDDLAILVKDVHVRAPTPIDPVLLPGLRAEHEPVLIGELGSLFVRQVRSK